MKAKSRHAWIIFIPVAIVLGLVAVGWVRAFLAPKPSANSLLDRGMKIDASFVGLSDAQGNPANDRRFAGRYLLVAFGFTSCPDVCPTMLLGVRQALEQLGPDSRLFAPVFVSVDPERDTAERVGAYVASFDPRILGLVGSPEAVAQVTQRYRAYAQKHEGAATAGDYAVDHTAMIYLIDPQQRIRALIPTGAGPQDVAWQIVRTYRAVRSRSS